MPAPSPSSPRARGSRRVPGKNIAPLAGHPLIAYSIAAARESGLFDASSSRPTREEIADGRAPLRRRGARAAPGGDGRRDVADIEWVRHVLDGHATGSCSRSCARRARSAPAATIRARLGRASRPCPDADSLRAVRPVREHPGKMWRLDGELMAPLLPQAPGEVPTHSRQTAALPEPCYVQDSSLEIAWTRIVADGEIAGRRVVPFFPEGVEGLSIDYPDDLERAERARRRATRRCCRASR